MIRVQVKRNGDQAINGFIVKGHANSARNGELDMVCAAVSAVVETTILGLDNLISAPETEGVQKDGYLECSLPEYDAQQREKAELLIDTMLYGLKTIAQQYPKCLQIKDNI